MGDVDVEARHRTAAIVSESEVSDVHCRLRPLPPFQALVFSNGSVDGANALGLNFS